MIESVSCRVFATGEDSSNDVRGTDVRPSAHRRQRGGDFPAQDQSHSGGPASDAS